MTQASINSSPYKGTLTREQFLFYEMRTTAKLLSEGLDGPEAVQRIIDENLFQYPTERMIKNLANVCVSRLRAMEDDSLIRAVATLPVDVSKQICLYAMMKDNRLMWDFMTLVIGEKFRQNDMSFGKIDLNVFFMRLQEQDDHVAAWSDSTVAKIKSVMIRVLIENGYLDDGKSDHLNRILIDRTLENAIRSNGDDRALAAFNCFD